MTIALILLFSHYYFILLVYTNCFLDNIKRTVIVQNDYDTKQMRNIDRNDL